MTRGRSTRPDVQNCTGGIRATAFLPWRPSEGPAPCPFPLLYKQHPIFMQRTSRPHSQSAWFASMAPGPQLAPRTPARKLEKHTHTPPGRPAASGGRSPRRWSRHPLLPGGGGGGGTPTGESASSTSRVDELQELADEPS